MIKFGLKVFLFVLFSCFTSNIYTQNHYLFTGRVVDAANGKPIQNATIQLKVANISTISKTDGTFKIHSNEWYDSLEITCVSFEPFLIVLHQGHTNNITVPMKHTTNALQEVIVGASKKPAKSFMQKVIDYKANNDPSRFRSYSYQGYARSELDIDNIDFNKTAGKGLKSSMLKAYGALDSTAKSDKELPIYFTEKISNNYHSVFPKLERENVIAKKTLGLKTDKFISRLDKFYFNFNVYDDWIPIFDQSYASPLNRNAFNYYNFFEGLKMADEGDTLQQIQFTPRHSYERAFAGSIWINVNTLAVTTINMHLNKTANINYVNDINYYEDYKLIHDSAAGKSVYMPYKFLSEVKFESGIDLLGLPVPENKNSILLIIKNTTVVDDIQLNTFDQTNPVASIIKTEQTVRWEKPDTFWQTHRSDSLTDHEKNIYKMVDSLKHNGRFQRELKLIAFTGSGYWDFNNKIRIGPYSSFMSSNSIEGWRFRLGFWTMPGISKNLNLFGYGAYGTRDQKIKGMLGLKYIWNEARWTKTTFSYGSDYDFISDQDDELDNDNIISSVLRKKIPYTRIYIKQGILKHEQYISPVFTAKASISYKELTPAFDFQYRPINRSLDKPFDSVFEKRLPVAEASIGLRYARNERTKILNSDMLRLGTFSPIITASYTYGFEQQGAQFEFHKLTAGIEQSLRLPPKSLLYYKLETGKVFGTIPYLLLNIPAGNEYYVASKYLFNTMSPYEFAADRYISLHTRFHPGGVLFDRVPLLQRLGWRERFSFNSYWGDMTRSNIDYNKGAHFNLTGKTPFMEASMGIENIFHVLSIEYYKRLNYLNNPYAKKNGIYLGVYLVF